MNADQQAQLRLLDLQAVDSALDRLARRRETLPEIAQAADLAGQLQQAGDAAVSAEAEDADLAREQRKVEADVELVRSRIERDRSRLDTGAVSSPRELENLQSELASLARRQGELEDQVLDVMERRESVTARIQEQRERGEQLAGELGEVETRREALLAEIDDESSAKAAERKQLAGELPGELLQLYEKIRQAQGGVGAAALRQGRCEGCHLQLNTVDLNAVRSAPTEQVVRCEECRRILVRTPESGL